MVEGDLETLSLLDCTKSTEARKSAFPLLMLEPESQQTAQFRSLVSSAATGCFPPDPGLASGPYVWSISV